MIPCLQTLLYCLLVHAVPVAALSMSTSFVRRKPLLATTPNRKVLESKPVPRRGVIIMRDSSASYWFQRGDTVQVVADDVVKAGINLQNRRGRVLETWEKCDVDPTCCCAEQVDIHMAVRVEFQGTEGDPHVTGASFVHYFAEDELLRVQVPASSSSASSVVPFDGMTCTAFKLDHLQQSTSPKQRNIFKWEPVAPERHKEEPTAH